jgi:hypothetical protein
LIKFRSSPVVGVGIYIVGRFTKNDHLELLFCISFVKLKSILHFDVPLFVLHITFCVLQAMVILEQEIANPLIGHW